MIYWNNTTEKEEKRVLKLFKNYGIKVPLGKYTNSSSYQFTLAELSDIDDHVVSDRDIKNKMISVNTKIATYPVDDVLGEVLFTTVTDDLIDDGEKIDVTYADLYIYLRTILKRRIAKREKRRIDAEIKAVEATIEATKTTKERRADAKARLEELMKAKSNI